MKKYNYFISTCVDCIKPCNRSAKRCRKCADKRHSKEMQDKYRIKMTKEFLYKEYIVNKKSTIEISKILKCSSSAIERRLKKYSIKIRTISESRKDKFEGKNNPNYKGGLSKCIDCDKELSGSSKITKRCSKCWYIYLKQSGKFKGKNNPNWNNGSSFEPYPLGWNKTFKEQIRYRDGYKCQICGKPEIECLRKLDVHHIDYDKENLSLNNLISLCKSCHCRTNFNRAHWKEYFLSLGRIES